MKTTNQKLRVRGAVATLMVLSMLGCQSSNGRAEGEGEFGLFHFKGKAEWGSESHPIQKQDSNKQKDEDAK
jgi:hypothetical protein